MSACPNCGNEHESDRAMFAGVIPVQTCPELPPNHWLIVSGISEGDGD